MSVSSRPPEPQEKRPFGKRQEKEREGRTRRGRQEYRPPRGKEQEARCMHFFSHLKYRFPGSPAHCFQSPPTDRHSRLLPVPDLEVRGVPVQPELCPELSPELFYQRGSALPIP